MLLDGHPLFTASSSSSLSYRSPLSSSPLAGRARMTPIDAEPDELLRALDETHARLERRFLGEPAPYVPDPAISGPPPPPAEEWQTLLAEQQADDPPPPTVMDTNCRGPERKADLEARDSLATVSLASVGERTSVSSTHATAACSIDPEPSLAMPPFPVSSRFGTSLVRIALRRDSSGMFRLVLKRDAHGDVYIGVLAPSDSGDERGMAKEGEYVHSIDGMTVADIGFEGLLQHIKTAPELIVLEVERVKFPKNLHGGAAALAEALSKFGIVDEQAAAVAEVAAEREEVLQKFGLNTAAVASLATNIHRKGEEVKHGWNALGDWWREKSEAAGAGLSSLVQAAAPTLRETTEDVGHTLKQIGGELHMQADQWIKRTMPAPEAHQRTASSRPPPPPPTVPPPLCADWVVGLSSSQTQNLHCGHSQGGSLGATPIAGLSPSNNASQPGVGWGGGTSHTPLIDDAHTLMRSGTPTENVSSAPRISNPGWGDPIIDPNATAGGFYCTVRNGMPVAFGGNDLPFEEQMGIMARQSGNESSVHHVANNPAQASCVPGPQSMGSVPIVRASNNHDSPPIVAEMD